MVDAVSLSATSRPAAFDRPQLRASALATETRPAVSALAALSQPRPVTEVAAPSDIAEEIGDLSFLYAPNGLAVLPASAVPPTQAATETQGSGERAPGARLAIDSAGLNSLMSSFLTARAPDASAETPGQSVIARLYSQF